MQGCMVYISRTNWGLHKFVRYYNWLGKDIPLFVYMSIVRKDTGQMLLTDYYYCGVSRGISETPWLNKLKLRSYGYLPG